MWNDVYVYCLDLCFETCLHVLTAVLNMSDVCMLTFVYIMFSCLYVHLPGDYYELLAKSGATHHFSNSETEVVVHCP